MIRNDIFTTPFWYIEGTPQELVDELYQGAYKLKERYPSENKSNQGGYQTPPLEWKNFHPQGIEYIDKIIGDIFKFKVDGWWYNINGKGHWNIPHVHSDCDFALVWFLTDSDDLLNLVNPFPYRYNDNKNIVVKAKKKDIVMFPSDIQHFVMPNQKNTDRVSISMNLQLC